MSSTTYSHTSKQSGKWSVSALGRRMLRRTEALRPNKPLKLPAAGFSRAGNSWSTRVVAALRAARSLAASR